MDRNSIRKVLSDELASVDAEIRAFEAEASKELEAAAKEVRELGERHEAAEQHLEDVKTRHEARGKELAERRADVLRRKQAFVADESFGAPPAGKRVRTPGVQ